MKKKKVIMLLVLITMLVAACTNNKESTTSHNTIKNSQENKVDQDIPEKKHEGKVSIDISKYKNDEFLRQPLEVLQNNLQAIVDKDQLEFVKGFLNEEQSQPFLFWLGDEFDCIFSGEPEIVTQQVNVGKLLIAVNYINVKDNHESKVGYNFVKDTDGKWVIYMID